MAANIHTVELRFLNGRLHSLSLGFYPRGLGKVFEALKEKYGPPSKEEKDGRWWEMRWASKYAQITAYTDDPASHFAFYTNNADGKAWTEQVNAAIAAEQRIAREAKRRDAERERQADIRRRAKDL